MKFMMPLNVRGPFNFFFQNNVIDPWRFYGAVVFAALAVRLIDLAFISELNAYAQVEDSSIYWNGAQAWIDSGYFSRASVFGFIPETERMPLYHLFLVPFRWVSPETVWPVIVVQSLMDSTTCGFIAAIGMMVGLRVGVISGVLAALWPNMIIYSHLVLGDSLFLFLATIGLYASLSCLLKPRYSYALVAGTFFGLMILVRPIGLFVPIAAAGFILWRTSRQKGKVGQGIGLAMVVIALSAALLTPIFWRNITQFSTWQLTSQNGTHFLMWVVSYSKSLDQGIPFSEGSAKINFKLANRIEQARNNKAEFNDFDYSDVAAALAKQELKDVSITTLAKAWGTGMAINIASPAIISDPRIREINNGSFMNSAGSGLINRLVNFLLQNNPDYLFWILIGLTMSALSCVLQFIGWIFLCRERNIFGMVSFSWILYFLVIAGPVASPKYRLPIEPILIVAQAIAFSSLISRIRVSDRLCILKGLARS